MLVNVNARYKAQRTTGVQRYAQEIVARLNGEYRLLAPRSGASGVRGHLWEQFVLPGATRGGLLWSPCNTGPLAVRNQVVTIHDAAFIDQPCGFSKMFATWYRFLLPRLARRVRKVITVSQFSADRIMEVCQVPAERIAVIYNGVDAKFAPCDAAQIASVRTALHLPERYILSLGSLEPRKNLRGLLSAWEQVATRHAKTWLVIAGGSNRVFAEAGLQNLPPRVMLTGYVADEQLAPLYAGATAFAYPSLYEGFGLPVIEAMACGTPVVCSSTTSLPEVAGDAAEYVEPNSIESIAAGLDRILSDESLQANLRQRGFARAQEFSWDRAAEETWAVLQAASEELEVDVSRTPVNLHS